MISASGDIFPSCGRGSSKVGSPDIKLHWELTLLRDFVSHNAKGFSLLPELPEPCENQGLIVLCCGSAKEQGQEMALGKTASRGMCPVAKPRLTKDVTPAERGNELKIKLLHLGI